MINEYTAVIQAGGRGTRMEKLTRNEIPKPMLSINGKTMLEWQIENIKKYGIYDFILIIGYLGDKVRKHFGDGSQWGVRIQYVEEKEPLGSGGALFYLKPILGSSSFLLVFGDIMFDIALDRFVRFHESHGGQATLLAHPNSHPYDSDLLLVDDENRVTGIRDRRDSGEDWYENCVNAGIYLFSADVLGELFEVKRLDLEHDILMPLMKRGTVYGYRSPEYVKDAGTPERFYKISGEQQKGIWHRKNIGNKQPCIFLDRDGTVNTYQGLLFSEEAFELENGAADAVRRLNEEGFLTIVVTNQPVVARGLCGVEDVKRIHRKMQTLLGEEGAYLDDIVFCPHHPDRGYPEENSAYKISCKCRKPEIGMIEEMAEKYNIDMSRSFMVGDSTVDVQTAHNAGLRSVLVLTGQAGKDGKYGVTPDIVARNLGEAVELILRECRDYDKEEE